jgi:hypothetical protein
MVYAGTAVTCYLHAAGLYKNCKSRPLLTRVLWLLSVDDANFTISRSFDTYKGRCCVLVLDYVDPAALSFHFSARSETGEVHLVESRQAVPTSTRPFAHHLA